MDSVVHTIANSHKGTHATAADRCSNRGSDGTTNPLADISGSYNVVPNSISHRRTIATAP